MNKKYLAFLFLFVMGMALFAPCHNTTADGGGLLPEGWKEDNYKGTAQGTETWLEKLSVNSMVKWVISGIVGAVAAILFLMTEAFMGFSQILLTWVTSEGFINIKFTSNAFVDIGWNMTRDFTNILIVLGLVVIALATILRISSYQMKKTLPLLLIVALLVNFTPMLCGIVIDASNIVMEHFLKAGHFLLQEFGSKLSSGMSELLNSMGSPSSMLATGLLLVGTGLFSGIIFLLYAFLFLFRYVALWMLVIISPLALFCYIFPATKKMWNMWLSQFIQWCFIGIPAAFTIYLANEMTRLMLDGELLGEMSSMGKIMGYIVPVTFLAVGFFVSLQTGAMGASMITSKVRQAPQKIGGAMAMLAATGTVGGLKGLKEGKGIKGKVSGAIHGTLSSEGREGGRETIETTLEKMHVVRPGFYKSNKRKRLHIEDEEKRMKELPPEELERIANMKVIFPMDRISKAVATKILGDIGAFKFKGLPQDVKKKEQAAINLANSVGVNLKGLGKSRPDLISEINKKGFQQQILTETNDYKTKNPGKIITKTVNAQLIDTAKHHMIQNQVKKINPKDFTEKTSNDSMGNYSVFSGMTAAQIKKVGEEGDNAKIKAIEDAYTANKGAAGKTLKEIRKHKADKNQREARRMSALIKQIRTDPNFSI